MNLQEKTWSLLVGGVGSVPFRFQTKPASYIGKKEEN
jgi:hypothetical protein